MSFGIGQALFSQPEGFVKAFRSLETEEVSHAPAGLRGNGPCAMVRLVPKAGTFPYAEPGSAL